jgi:hypothetical protein
MPPLCQDNRIACVSATQTDVKRMVALPLDTTVHFESSVKSIDLQRHSGKRIKWSLRENPAVSLEASGYPPTTDPNATVRVKIDAQETQNGVVMHVLVSEGPLQTARFTTTFGHGSKLERDERGAVHVAIEAPSNIDTMIRGSYKDESNEPYMIDQIYALLRQAIGTEQEARESAVRLVRTARITSRVEGDVGGVSAKARWDGALIEPRCEQFMTVNFNGPVHSGSVGELGFRLSEVRFTRSPDTPPHTNIHSSEHVICEDGGVLILGYGGTGTNPLFSYRKYSADGKLRRYVQSPLPPRKEDWDFIDLGTVRESATAITFDLVSMQLTKRKDRFVKRESFEIPL